MTGDDLKLYAKRAGLSDGQRILELGCGAGNHAAVMLAEGFVLRATDGSPEMAEVASRRINHPVEPMLFDELRDREAYDGVWASACLLHVPRDELAGIIGRIHRALKPAGVFDKGKGRLKFILKEGRNRQIRRMCELVELEVVDLLRTRVGPTTLGALPEGRWRPLAPEERAALIGQ